ncbi:unnamed protein product [Brassicogethes aeneus]|uniref:Uncharacterized protein n=1 Tax=Brassicogethes aeneus TaxID=1431903 RepID=A0A9P0B001_BRAAE|nr:unnamed protein product [Brassicogethes aeneus]
MKSFCVLVFIALGVICSVKCKPGLTVEQFAKITEYSKKCRETSGATVEQMLKVMAGEYENDPKLKAQLFCINKKVGIQDESGKLNMAAIMAKLSKLTSGEKETEDVMRSCAVDKESPEETAYSALKCVFDTKGINLIG